MVYACRARLARPCSHPSHLSSPCSALSHSEICPATDCAPRPCRAQCVQGIQVASKDGGGRASAAAGGRDGAAWPQRSLCALRTRCSSSVQAAAGCRPSTAWAAFSRRRITRYYLARVDAPPMPLCQRGAVAAVASRDRKRAIGADRRACADRMLMGPRWHSMRGIGLAVGDLRCGMVLLASWHQTSGVGLVPWTARAVCWLSCAACVVHVAHAILPP